MLIAVITCVALQTCELSLGILATVRVHVLGDNYVTLIFVPSRGRVVNALGRHLQ